MPGGDKYTTLNLFTFNYAFKCYLEPKHRDVEFREVWRKHAEKYREFNSNSVS